MTDWDYDIVVIGAGSAGIGAAQSAKRRGASVLMVSEGRIGGDCTFTGCVPSKTLIETAHQGLPFTDAMARVHQAIERIAAAEDDATFEALGIEVVHQRARFIGTRTVQVGDRVVTGERFVVATGSRPAIPSLEGLSEVPYLTNETVFGLSEAPSSMVIVGSGPIGCELAQAFRRFGVEVTLLSRSDRLLPKEEPEASAVIAEVFAREGIDVRLGISAVGVSHGDGMMNVATSDGDTAWGEALLLATGRTAGTAELGLVAAGIEVDGHGYIKTDEHLATTAEGVYAAGDVTGRLQFTHAAYEMANVATHNAFTKLRAKTFETRAIPWVTFTDPEVARVGRSENDAASQKARVAILPMDEVDRAITAGETDGFIKLIAGPRKGLGNAGGGHVLGCTIVASRAGEMIHEAALAMQTDMFAGRLAQTVHAYPTWSMAVQQAAAQFFITLNGRRAQPARSDEERARS